VRPRWSLMSRMPSMIDSRRIILLASLALPVLSCQLSDGPGQQTTDN
jgi:hypothetical protein